VQAWVTDYKTLVLLGVSGEEELSGWEQKLKEARIRYKAFREPDRDNQLTAVAVHPESGPELFRELRVL